MPILNYSTSISTEKTIGQIVECLVKHGASKIIQDYDTDRLAAGLSFGLIVEGNVLLFTIKANWMGVLKAMQKDKKCPQRLCNKEQALRVSWRILKDWIQSQMAIVEAQQAELAEVFLAYCVTKNGDTLYDNLKTNGSVKQLLLTEG